MRPRCSGMTESATTDAPREDGIRAAELADLVTRVTAAVMRRGGEPASPKGWMQFSCLQHDDATPSAAWHPVKMRWTCLGCQAGGGVLDLAQRLGVELPKARHPGRRRPRTTIASPPITPASPAPAARDDEE